MSVHHFPDDGRTPNHPELPLVVMQVAELREAADPARWLEVRFTANGWSGTWRWGVYPFHHFHTTNHEVLGVSSGTATLLLGGEKGGEFEVGLGDVIVLPAGLGHKCLRASPDFQVVGAYPGGDSPDLLRSGEVDPDEMNEARRRVARVPLPERDPIHGSDGPLVQAWKLRTG